MKRIGVLLASWLFVGGTAHAADPKPTEIYAKCLPSIVTLQVRKSDGSTHLGSAFLAIKDGILVTAWHVVRDASRATAKFSTGEEFETSGLIDKDEKRDIALVRLKAFGRPMLTLSRTTPKVASRVYAIGAPKGLEFSISDGLLSQIQKIDASNVYQFTSPVSPGNSGGPLINEAGEVAGVVKGQLDTGQNLNFATPSTYVLGLDTTLPTKPWDAVAKTPADEPAGAVSGKREGPGGRSVTLAADRAQADDVEKLCVFLKEIGLEASAIGDNDFRMSTASHKVFAQLLLDDDVDRIQFKVMYGVEPRYANSDELHAFILESNQKYNIGSFSLEDEDSTFVVSLQLTFVDRLDAVEIKSFVKWMDAVLLLYGLRSKASTYLK